VNVGIDVYNLWTVSWSLHYSSLAENEALKLLRDPEGVARMTEFARESDSTRDIQKELERILVTVRDGRDDQLKAQFRLAMGLGLGLLSIIAAYF